MDTTAEEIYFKVDGTCSFCHGFDSRVSRRLFKPLKAQHLKQLEQQLAPPGAKLAKNCIIGLSGGLDSSYTLVWAVEAGVRPVVVHVDAGWNSSVAVQNILALVKQLNLELETIVIPWEKMAALQLAFLRSGVPNQDIPQDHAFFASLMRASQNEKIPFLLQGNNLATESILPKSWGHSSKDFLHLASVAKAHGLSDLRGFPQMPPASHGGPKLLRPLDLMTYSPNIAKEKLAGFGWTDYGAKHTESLWTKYFQRFYLPYRFGFDKRKAHLSSEILAGNISRDSALEELTQPLYDPAEREHDEAFIARKLGITYQQFASLRDQDVVKHGAYKRERMSLKTSVSSAYRGLQDMWLRT